MKKNILMLVLILLLLAIILAIALKIASNKDYFENEITAEDIPKLPFQENSEVGFGGSISGSEGGSSGGGGGGSSGVTGDTIYPIPKNPETTIPEDECGYYFKAYGVCTGRCPKGVCISEGRSCYCKNIQS